MNLFNLRKDIVEVGRRVWNRGYVASNEARTARDGGGNALFFPCS